ncbi:MAG: InlB B-repeat-containing protein [Clostridia bacterium]|nr:InlB B-repeat-containing protein [Clostridia bacterium]
MRYVSFLCCFLVLSVAVFAPFVGVSVSVSALESSLAVGLEYKNSGFYDRLLEVELTGDQRYDAVSIALSQLGYHEGDCEADMDGLNPNGGRNFVEYTRVWGKVDNQEGNGVSYGYAWCAAFVSWCLRQAQVPKETALTEISCTRMTNWYKNRDIFHYRESGYTPILGDIIMFTEDNTITHVGLVLGVKDDRVYTVEGNGGEKVATHSYKLTSDYVYGYCVPNYTVKEGMDYEGLMESALNPTGNYIVTAKLLNVFAEAASTAEIVGTLNKGDKVEVIGFEGSFAKIKRESDEAWVAKNAVTHEKYMIYTVKYNLKGGKGDRTEQRKLLGDSITIGGKKPTKTGHKLIGWSLDKSAKTVDYEHGAEYTADADVTLYAVWQAHELTVTYYNEDGTVFEAIDCKYNDWLPEPESTPVKPDDEEYSYTFAGWDKDLERVVVRNLEYTATFTATPLPPKAEESSGADPLVIGLCLGGGVLVIGAVVAIIALKKRKKDAA